LCLFFFVSFGFAVALFQKVIELCAVFGEALTLKKGKKLFLLAGQTG